VNLNRTIGRAATVAAATGLATAGFLGAAPQAQAAFVACSTNLEWPYSASCTRDTTDGDAGGVSGATRATQNNSGAYARAEFTAKGEYFHMKSTSNVYYDVRYYVYTHKNGEWVQTYYRKLSAGNSMTTNLSIAEDRKVLIRVCPGTTSGCTSNTTLVA
jgi:hypothetical protein